VSDEGPALTASVDRRRRLPVKMNNNFIPTADQTAAKDTLLYFTAIELSEKIRHNESQRRVIHTNSTKSKDLLLKPVRNFATSQLRNFVTSQLSKRVVRLFYSQTILTKYGNSQKGDLTSVRLPHIADVRHLLSK